MHQRTTGPGSKISSKGASDASTIAYATAGGSLGQGHSKSPTKHRFEPWTDTAHATPEAQKLNVSFSDVKLRSVTDVAELASSANLETQQRSTSPDAATLTCQQAATNLTGQTGSPQARSIQASVHGNAAAATATTAAADSAMGAEAGTTAAADSAMVAEDHTTAAADSFAVAEESTKAAADTVTPALERSHTAREAGFAGSGCWKGKGRLGPCPLQQPILEGPSKFDRFRPG